MALTERWTICRLGHVHWGARGGAGFLFRHRAGPSAPTTYLLAQRSRWVDEGNSWGIPGGALREDESPEEAARREVREELSVLPRYRVSDVEVQDCGGGWQFTIFTADVDREFDAFVGRETDAFGWFTGEQIAQLSLHPGLRRMLDGRVL